MGHSLAYSRDELLQLYSTAPPTAAVVACIRPLGLRAVCCMRRCLQSGLRITRPSFTTRDSVFICRYRGCRSGRFRPPPSPQPLLSTLPPSPPSRACSDRHSRPQGKLLNFGCLNIRSLQDKVDDLLDVRGEHGIDVLFLTETWHDSDSVCIRRLRAEGFQVFDRPRPRTRDNTIGTNHGGIAAVACPGVRLTPLDTGVKPKTFELQVVRVAVDRSSCIAAVVYRPGSQAVTSRFFVELSDVMDRLATFVDPMFLVGDINIRLDRPTEPHTVQLNDTLASYGLTNRVVSATHSRGGLLDIVATSDDLMMPSVDVLDVGLSDHHLLRWPASLVRPCPVYSTVTNRPWKQLDPIEFRSQLQLSRLCCPDSWSDLSVDDLARLYDVELTAILDRLIPFRTITSRRRVSDPWFDDDCRVAKRCVRLFERSARRARRSDPSNGAAAAAATAAWYKRRHEYRALLHRKRESFWKTKIAAEHTAPRKLWSSIDTLMGRSRAPTSVPIDADKAHRFFDDKVAGVRSTTDNASPPAYSTAPPNCRLGNFNLLTTEDVIAAVRLLPDKQCLSDPLSTQLLKNNVDELAPFLIELFNQSLTTGTVPASFKAAYITPLLKKPDADPTDAKFYRPISNLSVLSKLLERLVAKQLLDFLTTGGLLPDLQSAYRAYHSTETAVLKVLSDILLAVDSGDLAVLTLLDLSAAFDTVDPEILLRRLRVSYGLDGSVLGWFTSYLHDRTQFVRCGSHTSTPTPVSYGVPQGSVLGPILFLLYTADLIRLVESHGLSPHLYADDTQIYGFCRPGETAQLGERVSTCIAEVATWMRSNRLQLNTSKTEIIWCSSERRQQQIPITSLTVGADAVIPVNSVRNLGIHINSDLSMRIHISKTVSSCFSALRQIRSIRRSITRPVLLTLVSSLVLTKLDYGCATLAGLPTTQLNRLQSVLNAAARLIFSIRKYDHITPLLKQLHWLRVPERITFRLATLAYRCQHGMAPHYLATQLHRKAEVSPQYWLRSASTAAIESTRPPSQHKTIGDRAFCEAAANAWNSLSATVHSSESLSVFRRRLKTELFQRSFP